MGMMFFFFWKIVIEKIEEKIWFGWWRGWLFFGLEVVYLLLGYEDVVVVGWFNWVKDFL